MPRSSATSQATLEDYETLMGQRIRKFDAEEVGYGPAPEGSAIICAACLHYFHRAIDGLAICEVVRIGEGDEPIAPNARCQFQTLTGDTFPILAGEQ